MEERYEAPSKHVKTLQFQKKKFKLFFFELPDDQERCELSRDSDSEHDVDQTHHYGAKAEVVEHCSRKFIFGKILGTQFVNYLTCEWLPVVCDLDDRYPRVFVDVVAVVLDCVPHHKVRLGAKNTVQRIDTFDKTVFLKKGHFFTLESLSLLNGGYVLQSRYRIILYIGQLVILQQKNLVLVLFWKFESFLQYINKVFLTMLPRGMFRRPGKCPSPPSPPPARPGTPKE